MTHNEFKKMKVGSEAVIIRTGELGMVTAINRDFGKLQVTARQYGLGITHNWYHYTELAKI